MNMWKLKFQTNGKVILNLSLRNLNLNLRNVS